MPLRGHLRELRLRIGLALIGIAIGAIIAWFLYTPVIDAITAPIRDLQERPQLAALNFTTIGSAFDLRIQVSIFVGAILSAPWWLGQMWAWIAPAMYRKEKLWTLLFVVVGTILFAAGCAFGFWIMPHAVQILTSMTPEEGTNLMDARPYLIFYLRVMVVFGVGALIPLAMVGANLAGIVRARTFLKSWRWAVVGAFVFGAIANPLPDAWSMILMSLPILGLYFLAIGICALVDRRRDRAAASAGDLPLSVGSSTGQEAP